MHAEGVACVPCKGWCRLRNAVTDVEVLVVYNSMLGSTLSCTACHGNVAQGWIHRP